VLVLRFSPKGILPEKAPDHYWRLAEICFNELP